MNSVLIERNINLNSTITQKDMAEKVSDGKSESESTYESIAEIEIMLNVTYEENLFLR